MNQRNQEPSLRQAKKPSTNAADVAVIPCDDMDQDSGQEHETQQPDKKKPPPSSSGSKKSSKQRRSKKPVDMPCRARTAYNYFFKEQRLLILRERKRKGLKKSKGDVLLPGSMAQIVSQRWKQIKPLEMDRLQKLAAADLKRYSQEMAEYQQDMARKYGQSSTALNEQQDHNQNPQREDEVVAGRLLEPAAAAAAAAATESEPSLDRLSYPPKPFQNQQAVPSHENQEFSKMEAFPPGPQPEEQEEINTDCEGWLRVNSDRNNAGSHQDAATEYTSHTLFQPAQRQTVLVSNPTASARRLAAADVAPVFAKHSASLQNGIDGISPAPNVSEWYTHEPSQAFYSSSDARRVPSQVLVQPQASHPQYAPHNSPFMLYPPGYVVIHDAAAAPPPDHLLARGSDINSFGLLLGHPPPRVEHHPFRPTLLQQQYPPRIGESLSRQQQQQSLSWLTARSSKDKNFCRGGGGLKTLQSKSKLGSTALTLSSRHDTRDEVDCEGASSLCQPRRSWGW